MANQPGKASEGPGQDGGYEIGPGLSVPESAITFDYVRSSGPGGQNVNRRATKARLRVSMAVLSDVIGQPAARRLERLAPHLVTDGGELLIASDTHRSQRANREACLQRLREWVVRALHRPPRRIKTKPSAGARERRLKTKRERAQTKQMRRRPTSE